MKIRLGFVSNSSSSSFICDGCNYAETSYDGEGQQTCEHGHTFCYTCVEEGTSKDDQGYLLPEHCPICNKSAASDRMILDYLIKTLGISHSYLEKIVIEDDPTKLFKSFENKENEYENSFRVCK